MKRPGRWHVRDPNMCCRNKRKELNLWKQITKIPSIQLVGLGKQFQTMNGPVTALEDINLDIGGWGRDWYYRRHGQCKIDPGAIDPPPV